MKNKFDIKKNDVKAWSQSKLVWQMCDPDHEISS